MPKVHWPSEVDRSLCGLATPSTQFTFDAGAVTCERCRKLLPSPTRTRWDRINDEEYEPPPRPRREPPVSEPDPEPREYKQEDEEDDHDPPLAALTPEEQDRQREEVLANFPTTQRLREQQRQLNRERRRLQERVNRQERELQQLRREQIEERTRLEIGREVTRRLISDYYNLCRRDLLTGVLVAVMVMIGMSVLIDMISSIVHVIISMVQFVAHGVHTWLTAHK